MFGNEQFCYRNGSELNVAQLEHKLKFNRNQQRLHGSAT